MPFPSLVTPSLSGELVSFLQVVVQVCGLDEALSTLSVSPDFQALRGEIQTLTGFC